MTIDEIKTLFEYYLVLITSHQPVIDFVNSQGFENLQRLLAAVQSAEVMDRQRPQYLFVYGTLRCDGRHEMYRLFSRYADFVGKATYRGRLYLIDDFPGATPSSDPSDIVRGEVYRLESPKFLLDRLDEYEEYDRRLRIGAYTGGSWQRYVSTMEGDCEPGFTCTTDLRNVYVLYRQATSWTCSDRKKG